MAGSSPSANGIRAYTQSFFHTSAMAMLGVGVGGELVFLVRMASGEACWAWRKPPPPPRWLGWFMG